MLTFNELAIGTVFEHPLSKKRFIKFAHAIPHVSLHNQSPNSFCLDSRHYFCVGAISPVEIIKEPEDCDDSHLKIV